MPWVMKVTNSIDIERLAAIQDIEAPWTYLKSYDPNGNGGRGTVHFTKNPALAQRFATVFDVLETWKQQSTVLPRRPDGQPNRPLTAFTIEPEELP